MKRYYCPFCSTGRVKHFQEPSSSLNCKQCGERLLILPVVRFHQILGILTAAAFAIPLLVMVLTYLNEYKNRNIPKENSVVKLHSKMNKLNHIS